MKRFTAALLRDIITLVALLMIAAGVCVLWTFAHALIVSGAILLAFVVRSERRSPGA